MAEFEFRVATEFNVVKVKVTKEIQARVDELVAKGICLGCEEPILDVDRRRRGLCSTCYTAVCHGIHHHGVSAKALMEAGKLLPKKPGGRKPKNKFTASLYGRDDVAPGEVKKAV